MLLVNQRTKKMLESVRLSGGRAYLFRGERGMGRMTYARQLAAEYFDVPVTELCDQPDYFELSTNEKLGIGDLSGLHAFTGYLPANVSCKIAVLDAGRVTEEAQSSLLKLLEDGATHVCFFLVVADRLLATIESRCRVIDFFPVSEKEMLSLGNPAVARQLAAGRPGIFYELAKPEQAEYLSACRDATASILAFDGKQLLEMLHLAKEKDRSSFFECYGRERVLMFLRYVGDRLNKQMQVDYEHGEVYRELGKVTSDAYVVLKTAATYSKNDFFEYVRRLITCMNKKMVTGCQEIQ